MVIFTRGVYLWVALCAVGPEGIMGHNGGAWGGHRWSWWKGFGVVYVKYTPKLVPHDRGTYECGVDGWVNRA